jgi:hypothetical protein
MVWLASRPVTDCIDKEGWILVLCYVRFEERDGLLMAGWMDGWPGPSGPDVATKVWPPG